MGEEEDENQKKNDRLRYFSRFSDVGKNFKKSRQQLIRSAVQPCTVIGKKNWISKIALTFDRKIFFERNSE
jgi:hypothetical protein